MWHFALLGSFRIYLRMIYASITSLIQEIEIVEETVLAFSYFFSDLRFQHIVSLIH